MRDWCPEDCAEWTPFEQGRERITLERMARAVGKTEEQVSRLREEAEELNLISTTFAR